MKSLRFLSNLAFATLALLLVVGLGTVGLRPVPSQASSHREAPMLIGDPLADNTDVYAFVSPDRPDTVTLIANFNPFENPGNGPNFYRFGDDVLYEIQVDNVGDALPHITYQFRFNTQFLKPTSGGYNDGPIESIDSPNLNIKQYYSVTRIENGQATTLGQNLLTPPAIVGPKSTPNYEALSNAAIHDLSDGSRVWAGQADDPFFVDFSVFDLLSIRKLPGNAGGGLDGLRGFNVQSIVLQVPITRLALGGTAPSSATAANAVIGVWSTTSRQATRVLQTGGQAAQNSGDWVQISRLAAPLANEVLVPMGAKDLFNSSQPKDDAQFLSVVTDPEPARLLNKLYNIQVPPTPRDDLVAIFLTGIPGLTQPPNVKPSEELRLNMAVPPAAAPNRLGVVGGDTAGFPNGRRLADDVFDIEVKGLAGAAYPLFHPGFGPDPLAAQLGDGVDTNDKAFRTAFPYVALPHEGTINDPFAGGRSGGGGGSVAPAPAAGGQPGMPRTGSAPQHLADFYGWGLALLVAVGGLIGLGGLLLRRQARRAPTRK